MKNTRKTTQDWADVMRLLEKDPDRRYQSSEEVQRALAEAKGISVL